MTISNIAVYQPSTNSSSATWSQTSSWKAGVAGGNNLVFMNNKGGGASGEWSGTYQYEHGIGIESLMCITSLRWR